MTNALGEPSTILLFGGLMIAGNHGKPELNALMALGLLFMAAVALHTHMYDLRPEPDRPVVAVTGRVMEADDDRHGPYLPDAIHAYRISKFQAMEGCEDGWCGTCNWLNLLDI